MSNNYNYSIIKYDANLQGILDDISAASPDHDFGKQSAISQDGLYIIIDCRCPDDFSHLIAIDSRIAAYIVTDVVSYLPDGTENLTQSEAKTIVQTTGESGAAWSAPFEV